MSRPIIVLGDKTDHGGTVISASTTMDIDGKGVARVGDKVICPKHGPSPIITTIATGDPTNIVDGQPVARHGDKTACGATLISSQATSVVDSGASARGSDLGSVVAGLATLVGQSNALITASTNAASAVSSILSGQTQSGSSTAQSYPRVEEAEEEEEIGESEMGPSGPLDHVYEEIIRVMEMELEKQRAVLGAADLAEQADILLSVVEMARPRAIIRIVKAAGAEAIESALGKGTSALRDASVNAVGTDLDIAKMHLRKSIKRLEDQIEEARRILERRNSGEEKFTEFQAAQEREALEKYLKDAANSSLSEIRENVEWAKRAVNSANQEAKEADKVYYDYLRATESAPSLYDYNKEQVLSENALDKKRNLFSAEQRVKDYERASRSAEAYVSQYKGLSGKIDFGSTPIEEQIRVVDQLKKEAFTGRLFDDDNNSPFRR
ncbi:PAAR domain-containing protein [Alloalcanivorax xenomutans]|uniref:PAAR domain-containing protein n=1 Tax=Alloalcanivorax xenomutans TaxID=1094342 RepID=UPI002934FA74|nr:PAAR domain-containing protein [Alloalcanivorax xenomutans]WOD27128.1 PAAR domain-containing protein [Alloalcanivorax xenomutans]